VTFPQPARIPWSDLSGMREHRSWPHFLDHGPGSLCLLLPSEKKSVRKDPEGSALPGTEYHWFILAHLHVRKVDQDTYGTVMQRVKYKIAHKRPHWRGWSESEWEILIRILEQYLAELKDGSPCQAGLDELRELIHRIDPPQNPPSPAQQ